RHVGAEHAERRAVDHRVRHAGDLAGPGDEVAEEVDDRDPDNQRHQDLPARQAQGEEAARGHVPADAVHVGHPEREDVVRAPRLFPQWGEVLVGEPGVVLRLDESAAHRMTGGLDDVGHAVKLRTQCYATMTGTVYFPGPTGWPRSPATAGDGWRRRPAAGRCPGPRTRSASPRGRRATPPARRCP